ncbi:hypothetical protein PC117_g2176 [Phytophthora cactorum]|uniref:MULE transposase domain-containing protein n=1 Tax=Phytophthora cactorum TaxID=29920 RepID=A0A8T1EJ49_9STRA|nr:hypothetical protein PC117_g2176 [Phytophthora cactorum]
MRIVQSPPNTCVTNGSDAKLFHVRFTSKALLHQSDRDSRQFIFHVDATYKTNQVGYPVVVYGITDAARIFFLLALFVTSQQQEDHYSKDLQLCAGCTVVSWISRCL